ncbi:MAG: transcriptional regulator, partial [Candidatus Latescibacteria bacterium]|nr:transcriptional regulator [Candidatus Latescibacterota bacterium]
LRDYLGNVLSDPEVPSASEEWVQRLCGLGIMIEVPDSVPVCTIAGLVLFGHQPRRYLRQAGVRVMAFSGIDKEYQARLDEVLDGPMVGLWKKEADGARQLVSPGVIEAFAQTCRPFVSDENDSINEGMRRDRIWHYPFDALREIVINALVHRDWTRFTDIEISAYSNRLEVISPGALQNTMTVEKMIAGQRSPRNPLIVEVLRDYGYVDARGMGIRTKVIPLMEKENGIGPLFEATDDYLKTTLFRADNERG